LASPAFYQKDTWCSEDSCENVSGEKSSFVSQNTRPNPLLLRAVKSSTPSSSSEQQATHDEKKKVAFRLAVRERYFKAMDVSGKRELFASIIMTQRSCDEDSYEEESIEAPNPSDRSIFSNLTQDSGASANHFCHYDSS